MTNRIFSPEVVPLSKIILDSGRLLTAAAENQFAAVVNFQDFDSAVPFTVPEKETV